MSLKVARKIDVPEIEILLKGFQAVTIPKTKENEKIVHVILSAVQKLQPDLSFSTENGPIVDYLADIDSLGSVAAEQEAALETLRTENEELHLKLGLMERELSEAKSANEDWAAKFKKLKAAESETEPLESTGPSFPS